MVGLSTDSRYCHLPFSSPSPSPDEKSYVCIVSKEENPPLASALKVRVHVEPSLLPLLSGRERGKVSLSSQSGRRRRRYIWLEIVRKRFQGGREGRREVLEEREGSKTGEKRRRKGEIVSSQLVFMSLQVPGVYKGHFQSLQAPTVAACAASVSGRPVSRYQPDTPGCRVHRIGTCT